MLDDVEENLMGRAFLYEDPNSLREGVEASLEAVRAMLARHGGASRRSLRKRAETMAKQKHDSGRKKQDQRKAQKKAAQSGRGRGSSDKRGARGKR